LKLDKTVNTNSSSDSDKVSRILTVGQVYQIYDMSLLIQALELNFVSVNVFRYLAVFFNCHHYLHSLFIYQGRFLLAAASGRVLARSFHSVVHVAYDMIEKAAQNENDHNPENGTDMTWTRMEVSMMLEHVQAHVAPTDVDPGAGVQWLPKIRRSSPKAKRTGALLERVFMPCDMYFQYTRHKGVTPDLKVKPFFSESTIFVVFSSFGMIYMHQHKGIKFNRASVVDQKVILLFSLYTKVLLKSISTIVHTLMCNVTLTYISHYALLLHSELSVYHSFVTLFECKTYIIICCR